ncbi:MAG: NfeD family protein [Phycisphaeraceae bacterium]
MNAPLLTSLVLTLAQQNANGNDDGHGTAILWAIVLIGAAIALFFLELFVPSGGLIGTAAAVLLVSGIVVLFGVNTTLGLLAATIAMIALPFAVAFAIKIWPDTPIGRALTLRTPARAGADADVDSGDSDETDEPLPPRPGARVVTTLPVGTEGRAVTDLRPVGTVRFDDQREECLALGGTIEAGTLVRIVAVDGMHVKVRPVDAGGHPT